MATIGPLWGNWTTDLNASGLGSASGYAQSTDLDLSAGSADLAEVQVDVTAGTSTDIDVFVYGGNPTGTMDTTPRYAYNVAADDVRSFALHGMSQARIKVVDNAATNDGSVTVKHRMRQWTDTV